MPTPINMTTPIIINPRRACAFDGSTSPVDASLCCHPRLFLGGKRQVHVRAAFLWSRLSFTSLLTSVSMEGGMDRASVGSMPAYSMGRR